MFKELYHYYLNNTNLPSMVYKINVWFFINIKNFKLKVSNTLHYFILGLQNLK